MQKVNIPQENGGIFTPTKILSKYCGRKNPDRIKNPIDFCWDNKSYVMCARKKYLI
jgi:hypothetical protein